MSLERCSCCLTYHDDGEISIIADGFDNQKYLVCKECNYRKAVPLFVARSYLNSIEDGDTINSTGYTAYYKNEYIDLIDYFNEIITE